MKMSKPELWYALKTELEQILKKHGVKFYQVDQHNRVLTIRTDQPANLELQNAIRDIAPTTWDLCFGMMVDGGTQGPEIKPGAPPNDAVNRPSHYTTGKIEVIDFIEDQKFGYHLGNTVKYLCRAGRKDPSKEVEDLRKAAWYLQRRIEKLECPKL